MKSVTEFPSIKLAEGVKIKTALAAEGKTPEEIQQNLGEKFKFEGDKLKYFFNALDVAVQHADGLCRLLVVKFNEGENVPVKAAKIDELHYIPEFRIEPKTKIATKHDKKNTGKGKGNRQKESPW